MVSQTESRDGSRSGSRAFRPVLPLALVDPPGRDRTSLDPQPLPPSASTGTTGVLAAITFESTSAAARPAPRRRRPVSPYVERALLLWPRLDRAKLRRAGDDPRRIARVVAARSRLPLDEIIEMLVR